LQNTAWDSGLGYLCGRCRQNESVANSYQIGSTSEAAKQLPVLLGQESLPGCSLGQGACFKGGTWDLEMNCTASLEQNMLSTAFSHPQVYKHAPYASLHAEKQLI